MNVSTVKTTIKKYPVGSIAVAVSIIMLAAFFFRRSSAVDLRTELDRNTEEAQRHKTNITYSAQLEEQFKALEVTNQSVTGRLVNPQDLAINLEYFYKLEAETGVKLLDTRPGGNTGRPPLSSRVGYKSVAYAVSLQGSYSRVLTFMRRLEQGAYYCRVVNATCNPASQDSNSSKNENAEVVLSLTVEILGKA